MCVKGDDVILGSLFPSTTVSGGGLEFTRARESQIRLRGVKSLQSLPFPSDHHLVLVVVVVGSFIRCLTWFRYGNTTLPLWHASLLKIPNHYHKIVNCGHHCWMTSDWVKYLVERMWPENVLPDSMVSINCTYGEYNNIDFIDNI